MSISIKYDLVTEKACHNMRLLLHDAKQLHVNFIIRIFKEIWKKIALTLTVFTVYFFHLFFVCVTITV